jgi:acyl-CoA reductase-like NAD-dependent aldehyde dehydrogenase
VRHHTAEVWLVHPIYIECRLAKIKNPATLEALDAVPDCGAEEVERAVAAATAAQPAWSREAAGSSASRCFARWRSECVRSTRARALIESRDRQAVVRIA